MSVIGLFSQIQSAVYCGGCSTYCSPIDKKSVKVHKHPSGLFGVGLLVEVSVEVAQLGDRKGGGGGGFSIDLCKSVNRRDH